MFRQEFKPGLDTVPYPLPEHLARTNCYLRLQNMIPCPLRVQIRIYKCKNAVFLIGRKNEHPHDNKHDNGNTKNKCQIPEWDTRAYNHPQPNNEKNDGRAEVRLHKN